MTISELSANTTYTITEETYTWIDTNLTYCQYAGGSTIQVDPTSTKIMNTMEFVKVVKDVNVTILYDQGYGDKFNHYIDPADLTLADSTTTESYNDYNIKANTNYQVTGSSNLRTSNGTTYGTLGYGSIVQVDGMISYVSSGLFKLVCSKITSYTYVSSYSSSSSSGATTPSTSTDMYIVVDFLTEYEAGGTLVVVDGENVYSSVSLYSTTAGISSRTYTVASGRTCAVYAVPDTSGGYTEKLSALTEVVAQASYTDNDGVVWIAINSTLSKWVKLSYNGGTLYSWWTQNTSTADAETVSEIQATSTASVYSTASSGYTYADMQSMITSIQNLATSSTYDSESLESLSKMENCIGIPPKFNETTDPRYMTASNPSNTFGRAYTEMFMMNSTIFSIQPCKVSYLPGFSDDEQSSFMQFITDSLQNGNLMDDSDLVDTSSLSGQLFEAVPDYNTYINTVNLLARTIAMYLGIGDKYFMGTGTTKYKNMDYSFYKMTTSSATSEENGIFSSVSDTARAVADALFTSVINDDTYVHFYTTADATTVSDSMSVSTKSSSLETLFNSNLASIAADMQFLFSGSDSASIIQEYAEEAISTISGEVSDSLGGVLGDLIGTGTSYLNGGRLVFPQMLDDCSYDRSYTASLRLIATSGDPEDIFLSEYLPLCYIWPYVIPQMISDNMYRYPFLAKCDAAGLFHADLAAITNLRINRGGQDGSSWTADGLPFEMSVQFDVTPLYSKLMATNARHPILFLGNTALHEYLAAMCGVSFTSNQIELKLALVETLLGDMITDTVPSILRGYYSSGIANTIANIFTF